MAVRERDLSATIKFIHQGLTPHAMINFKKQRVFGKIFFVQNFIGSNPISPTLFIWGSGQTGKGNCLLSSQF
jgi:hypothetical protein